MAEVVKRRGDAATQVQFGKLATLRGYAFDAMAFPSSGVPAFLPLAHSADLASVYAVARQESEFIWRSASGAGAKGLMQILPSTAALTARRAGVAFDYARLIVDPAFNTQLGAAFLGQVMEDVGGSRELAFAAYNAGPGRVAQWIAAYGDPRNGTPILSTGSSASRSTRRATTCSGSARTSASTASALPTTRRRPPQFRRGWRANRAEPPGLGERIRLERSTAARYEHFAHWFVCLAFYYREGGHKRGQDHHGIARRSICARAAWRPSFCGCARRRNARVGARPLVCRIVGPDSERNARSTSRG